MYTEISKNAVCSNFMDEAKGVYEKLLKTNIKNIDPK